MIGRKMVAGMVVALWVALAGAGCNREPAEMCQRFDQCCQALLANPQYSSRDDVQRFCPPRGDMTDGSWCASTLPLLRAPLVEQSAQTRVPVPQQCQ